MWDHGNEDKEPTRASHILHNLFPFTLFWVGYSLMLVTGVQIENIQF